MENSKSSISFLKVEEQEENEPRKIIKINWLSVKITVNEIDNYTTILCLHTRNL